MDVSYRDHGQPGAVLLVKTPPSPNKDVAVKAIAERALSDAGKDVTCITNCNVGREYSIIELDNGGGTRSLVGHGFEAAFQETVTLKLSGERLPPHARVLEICSKISPGLHFTFDGVSLTISGSWSHVLQAREKIHTLIMESSVPPDTTSASGDTAEIEDVVTPPANHGSCYDSINVSPHVLTMMKNKYAASFGPGISHSEGTGIVHFRFSNEKDLDAAMDVFQNKSNDLEAKLKVDRLPVPRGVHKDTGFTMIVSELEDKYKDTIINWIDGEIMIEIISASLTEVKCDLDFMMKKRLQPLDNCEPAMKGDHSAAGNNTSWNLKKTFGSFFSSPPKVEYRKEIRLSFPKGRTLTLRHGNILDERVDALVNPANEFLSHGAGLARQIDKASKGAVTHYSKQFLDKMGGRVPTGCVVTTEAGNGELLCTCVMHAVGPNAHEIRSEKDCVMLLAKTVDQIVKNGCDYRCHSIAIPAISSGLFGMKKDTVAEVIMHRLVELQQRQPNHDYLKDIRVVIWDRETYEPFLVIALGIESSLKYH